MSEEKFKVHRAHKMLDWIENEVTDWAHGLVTEHFGVECPSELNKEQIEEVIEEYEELSDYAGGDWLAIGMRNVVSIWENENDVYLL
jgi:hypothetical protein